MKKILNYLLNKTYILHKWQANILLLLYSMFIIILFGYSYYWEFPHDYLNNLGFVHICFNFAYILGNIVFIITSCIHMNDKDFNLSRSFPVVFRLKD